MYGYRLCIMYGIGTKETLPHLISDEHEKLSKTSVLLGHARRTHQSAVFCSLGSIYPLTG